MRVSHLALAGASASAFLVVPDIPLNEETFSILPFEEDAKPVTRTDSVSVPCQQCYGKDAQLELDFELEDGMLLVNKVPLIPKIVGPYVADVRSSDESLDAVNLGVVLGMVGSDSIFLGPQDLRAADVFFTVREVDGVWMDDIPSVKVQISTSSDGRVAVLGDISVIEPKKEPEDLRAPSHTESRLHELFRKITGKGCRGRNRHHGQPMVLSGEQDDGLISHHHHHHHRPHHHYDNDLEASLERFVQILGHVANYIFLPLALGLIAGVGSALIALIITSLVMKVVGLFRGQDKPSDALIVHESAVDEKARLMSADVDELPQYEDAPAYEQAEGKQ